MVTYEQTRHKTRFSVFSQATSIGSDSAERFANIKSTGNHRMFHQGIRGYVAQRLGPILLIFVLLPLLLLALRGIQTDVNPKMILQVLLMAAFLGVASFVVGMLPLLYMFSSMLPNIFHLHALLFLSLEHRLDHLSALGTGLLLGTALGVIIPEYV